MENIWSRRSILKSTSSVLVTALAGCIGHSKSSKADCATEAISHGNGKILQSAAVQPDNHKANLRVLLSDGVTTKPEAYRITIFENKEKRYQRKINGEREHIFTIGTRPIEGRFRVVTYSRNGNITDELKTKYQCNDG